jgi:hypothetical protein
MDRMPQHNALRPMSGLQKAILQALFTLLHRRPPAPTVGVPYLDVVHAVAADKSTVTMALRQLMRRGLVRLFVPPGGWSRHVGLTVPGQEYVRGLSQEAQPPRAKHAPGERAEPEEPERRQRAPVRQRNRRRDKWQGRENRRARQRFW